MELVISPRAVEPDWAQEVALGNVPGKAIFVVPGRNASVGLEFEDVWGGGLLHTLDYDAQTGNFTAGLVLTGAGGATAVIVNDVDDGTTGTLTLRKITGTFVNDEVITDSSTGSADVNGTIVSLGILTYPTAGETWEVVCESTNDSSAGTGAQTIVVFYLDDTYTLQFEVVSLNGHTPVTMTATDSLRHVQTRVATWGSATTPLLEKANLGTIIIRDSTSKQIRTVIPYDDSIVGDEHGLNVSRDSHYTVPADTSGLLLDAFANTSKNHESDVIVMARFPGQDGFRPLGEQSIYQNSISILLGNTPVFLEAKLDLKFVARSNNTIVDVNTQFNIIETKV